MKGNSLKHLTKEEKKKMRFFIVDYFLYKLTVDLNQNKIKDKRIHHLFSLK